jgi:hypothetical protein
MTTQAMEHPLGRLVINFCFDFFCPAQGILGWVHSLPFALRRNSLLVATKKWMRFKLPLTKFSDTLC